MSESSGVAAARGGTEARSSAEGMGGRKDDGEGLCLCVSGNSRVPESGLDCRELSVMPGEL